MRVLLPAPKHADLANWNQADDLVLRYHYHVLPKGILGRLMVRLHRFVVAPEKASVNCVLFERETTKVLVELPASGNVIALRARGPERRGLLTVISADVDAINDALPGLRDKVGKWIPCHCTTCRMSAKPRLFEEALLRKRVEDRRLTMECPLSYENVDVLALLDGIRADKLPAWATERIVKIFLASSSELAAERDQFELYFRQLNDSYRKQGIYLEIVRWENAFNAISSTRSQDEYNIALRGCDVFWSLFFTKTGNIPMRNSMRRTASSRQRVCRMCTRILRTAQSRPAAYSLKTSNRCIYSRISGRIWSTSQAATPALKTCKTSSGVNLTWC
jgi:hypothetical protein